ncbi:MAG: hypothetical protein ACOYM2_00660 [Rectinemataceae bacterium]
MAASSVAAQVLVALIPILGIFLGSVVAFSYLLWTHRERKLLIQQGTWSPNRIAFEALCLLVGLVLTSVGLVISFLIGIVNGVGYPLLGGLIPFMCGVSLLLYVWLRGKPRA